MVVDKKTQVLIVGAGPTGLAAANLLGFANVNTVVLEKNQGTSDIPKGIYIDDEFFRTLAGRFLTNFETSFLENIEKTSALVGGAEHEEHRAAVFFLHSGVSILHSGSENFGEIQFFFRKKNNLKIEKMRFFRKISRK